MTSPEPIPTSGRIDVPVAHGQLEAILKERRTPFAAVVVCHPHPQGGGTMHNNVVYRVAKALGDAGATVLRFNFRGVGRSTGSYGGGIDEEEDARAALDFLEQRAPGVPLWMAGFSFGARVGLTVGAADSTRPEAVRGRAGAEDVRLPDLRRLAKTEGDHPGCQRRVRGAR